MRRANHSDPRSPGVAHHHQSATHRTPPRCGSWFGWVRRADRCAPRSKCARWAPPSVSVVRRPLLSPASRVLRISVRGGGVGKPPTGRGCPGLPAVGRVVRPPRATLFWTLMRPGVELAPARIKVRSMWSAWPRPRPRAWARPRPRPRARQGQGKGVGKARVWARQEGKGVGKARVWARQEGKGVGKARAWGCWRCGSNRGRWTLVRRGSLGARMYQDPHQGGCAGWHRREAGSGCPARFVGRLFGARRVWFRADVFGPWCPVACFAPVRIKVAEPWQRYGVLCEVPSRDVGRDARDVVAVLGGWDRGSIGWTAVGAGKGGAGRK